MNQKFEYYIKKILNKILLQLISLILLSALLIILATALKFKVGPYPAPLLYSFMGILLLIGIMINYISYRRNIWLLKHYEEDEDNTIEHINKYRNDVNNYNLQDFLFHLFNKKSYKYYDEAIKTLNRTIDYESNNESSI
ncbi:hypothetical protein KHQ81_08340 [Mycoplasmatota bacterium]|nr:hypothetical protein KHQ81_08340 [Mycoplasmatota bacterium]